MQNSFYSSYKDAYKLNFRISLSIPLWYLVTNGHPCNEVIQLLDVEEFCSE